MLDWPHSPVHRFAEAGTYILTGATHHKRLLFSDARRLDLLHESILTTASECSIELQSWSAFPNHYHLVAECPSGSLSRFVRRLHSTTALSLNAIDGERGRRVWYQCWDTAITNERSWIARMRYVIENPVRHGLVRVATTYPWCSASWFERTARPSLYETVMHFPIDRVGVVDHFEVPELSSIRESDGREG